MTRGISAVATALFLVAALLQWNDPDPLRWILAYGLAASLALAAALGRAWPRPTAAAALGYVVWALALLPGARDAGRTAITSFEMQSTGDEAAREALGLGICAVYCGWLAWRSRGSA